jgi:hypothetical protein
MELYVTGHVRLVEDTDGQLVDIDTFCSDWCHRDYCARYKIPYEGWNGCQELPSPAYCENCKVEI